MVEREHLKDSAVEVKKIVIYKSMNEVTIFLTVSKYEVIESN